MKVSSNPLTPPTTDPPTIKAMRYMREMPNKGYDRFREGSYHREGLVLRKLLVKNTTPRCKFLELAPVCVFCGFCSNFVPFSLHALQ